MLPYANRMGGLEPGAMDTALMVVSAGLLMLAALLGKRGTGGPVPVALQPGRTPLTRAPILTLPAPVARAIQEAMMGNKRDMATVFMAGEKYTKGATTTGSREAGGTIPVSTIGKRLPSNSGEEGDNISTRTMEPGGPRNFYDDGTFYSSYAGMRKDTHSANDYIERPYLEMVLPNVKGKRVLDLGCGMGTYVADLLSAAKVVDAVDVSENMLTHLRAAVVKRGLRNVNIVRSSIEDFDYRANYYDLVMSTLAFHYVAELDHVFSAIHRSLRTGGTLIFSVEHPVYTAAKNQGWEIDGSGEYAHWRMDNYFETGARRTIWHGIEVVRYHRTVEDFFNLLSKNGFQVRRVLEPRPSVQVRQLDPELDRHYRRPPFLMFVARKK